MPSSVSSARPCSSFLAVVTNDRSPTNPPAKYTTPPSVAIQPYNRLVTELTADVAALGGLGTLREIPSRPGVPGNGGTIHLYTRDGAWSLTLPRAADGSVVDNLDHTLVERLLIGDALGLDPDDKRITYVGGDYPASWLCDEVDGWRAALAVLIAPVTVDEFVAVNLARQKMPRKSTWFTPKARAGLVVAEIPAPKL